jgi:hypothetical protein
MQLSSLSTSFYSTPNSRYKGRRTAVGSRDIPASFEVSAAGVNNVSYIYKPVADLLGLIADSDAAAPAASASAGSRIAPFSSVLAANAAYESSMHWADEET